VGNPVRLKATVAEVIPHGIGVYQVRMRPETRIPRFRPGQFLHLALDDFDPTSGFWPDSRVFSIASGPGEEVLEIVYSVKGRYTSRMEREIAAGRSVWLKLPYGSFIIGQSGQSATPVVLVAGGTGISPFVPFIRAAMSQGGGTPVQRTVLHYGVRSPDMVLYTGLLAEAARSPGGIAWTLWIEKGQAATSDPDPPMVRRSGRLDPVTVARDGEAIGADYYLSAPPAMVEHFRKRLRELAVADERVRIDEWE
jgi:ferredoxin-NADP reductase